MSAAQAILDGWQAFRAGQSLALNPWGKGCAEAYYWVCGWQDARTVMEGK